MFKPLLFFSCFGLLSSIKAQTLVTAFTTKGNFEIEIYDSLAPITGGNFLDLVNDKFYDNIIFHRVIDNFMIQGGDPTGTGTGGPGYSITDEFHPDLSNVQKTISMANSGPNTGGSQFFINLVNNTYLDYDKAPLSSKHPVFGKVTQNFSVVQNIGNVSTNGNDKPINDVIIDSIRVGSLQVLTLNDIESKSDVSIYPNPISSVSKLEINSKLQETYKLSIVNPIGQILVEKSINLHPGTNYIMLNKILDRKFSNGYYFLHLNSKSTENISVPFLIKN